MGVPRRWAVPVVATLVLATLAGACTERRDVATAPTRTASESATAATAEASVTTATGGEPDPEPSAGATGEEAPARRYDCTATDVSPKPAPLTLVEPGDEPKLVRRLAVGAPEQSVRVVVERVAEAPPDDDGTPRRSATRTELVLDVDDALVGGDAVLVEFRIVSLTYAVEPAPPRPLSEESTYPGVQGARLCVLRAADGSFTVVAIDQPPQPDERTSDDARRALTELFGTVAPALFPRFPDAPVGARAQWTLTTETPELRGTATTTLLSVDQVRYQQHTEGSVTQR